MGESTRPEPLLIDILEETDLGAFEERICVDLQLTRLDHFDHVTDEELRQQAGLSLPSIRRLRQAIEKRKKKRRGFFDSVIRKGDKDPRPSILKRQEDCEQGSGGSITCLITKDQIKLMEKLGEGSFAEVRRAIWNRPVGGKKDVAVKLLRDTSLSEEIQQEIDHMHHLKHVHLIRLFGVVFSAPIMMVVELCEGGSLLDRMRSTSKRKLLSSKLCAYAVHVAKGMAYLEHKRFIHRDLACRNVLLTKDEEKAKIGDFGLMRALPDHDEHYIMAAQKKVPFAWCPPESLRRRQFSHASDVWSYGVTLWEMFTYGEEPWMGYRGPEILQRISDGERLVKPQTCPPFLYSVMMKCWSFDPSDRPKFVVLCDVIKEFQSCIGECKENVEAAGYMRCQRGDRIIIIEEGPPQSETVFAQNANTGEYENLHRNSFVVFTSGKKTNISGPLTGSFIHTGHGDARGGTSWGHPEKIDEIFLKNPMPLIEFDNAPSASVTMGAEVVGSIDDAKRRSQPVPLRPPPPNVKGGRIRSTVDTAATSTAEFVSLGSYSVGSTGTTDEVDPFAPFDCYSMLYGAPPSSSGATPTSLYYSPVPQMYAANACPNLPVVNTGSNSSVPDDPVSNEDVYNAVRRLDRDKTPPLIPPAPIVPQFSHTPAAPAAGVSLPSPMVLQSTSIPPQPTPMSSTHNYSATSQTNQFLRPNGNQTRALQQPAFNPQPSPMVQTTPMVQLAPMARSTPVVQPAPMSQPPHIAQPPPMAQPLPMVHPTTPVIHPTPMPQAQSLSVNNMAAVRTRSTQEYNRPPAQICVGTDRTRTTSEPDPFEVSNAVKELANRPRYSEYYHEQRQTQAISPCMPSPPVFSPTLVQSTPTPMPTASLRQQHVQNIATGVTNMTVERRQCVPSLAHAGVVSGVSTMPSTSRTTTAGHMHPTHRAHSPTAISPSAPLYAAFRATSVPDINKIPDKAVLDLFDPLSSKPNLDLVKEVKQQAPFASDARCSLVLHRCKDNVGVAIEQLKTEKLVDMGIAANQQAAAAALAKVNWDLNNAAAVLLG